ncbi:hypothetical protein ACLB2K_015659 [Fragaria x ananassa]
MAAFSIFKGVFRSARVCRNYEHPVEGLASQFGLHKQLFCTRPVQDDCTVSYLVRSCGLSPESATLVSHKVKLRSLEKPNSVLALLKLYGFSDTQISTLVCRHPYVLVANAQKTLLPKLEFFSSIGISRLDLARTLTSNPVILMRSLENFIVPCYNFLKSVVVSDVKVVSAWKHSLWIFKANLSKNVIPNTQILRELGMPESCIALLITYYAHSVMGKPDLFSQLVGQVQQLGFDPHKSSFVQAMHALSRKGTTWKRCQQAYRSWDWSDNDILSAFKLFPLCMTKSEKKIMETMDFLVNKMGWHSHKIAKYPHVLCYSLEKRIIPRCSVVKVLLLKGSIKEENLSLATVIKVPDKYFLSCFVTRYLDSVPELLNVYHGKLEVDKWSVALFYIFGKSLGSAHPMFSSLLYRHQAFAVAASHFGRRFISSSIIPAAQDDPTLSYLISSCGLSPKAATLASHKVKLRSLEQPNSVLALLRGYEFSDTQIATLVRRRPKLILVDAKKTLLPKLEFFSSIGMSRLDLAKIMTYNPNLLLRSLENCLIPCYNFLKSVVISDVKVVIILKQNSWIFVENLSKNVKPNIRLVTELGMPHSALALLVACFSKIVKRKPEFFSQLVRQVEEMGFNPGNVNFVQAMGEFFRESLTVLFIMSCYIKLALTISCNSILMATGLRLVEEETNMQQQPASERTGGSERTSYAHFPCCFDRPVKPNCRSN